MDTMRCGVLLAMVLGFVELALCGTIPGPPTDLQVLDLQRNNMTISWKRPSNDGNSALLDYTVFYKEKDGQCWKEHNVKDIKVTLLGLKPYRKYEIFVMASNQSGYGSPSLRVSNTTLEAEPESCPEISYFEAGFSPNIGIKLVREIPMSDRNGIIKYEIFYKNCSMNNEAAAVIHSSRINVHGDYIVVYNFTGSGYSLKVVAYTSAGYCKGYKNLPFTPRTDAENCSNITPSLATSPSPHPQTSTLEIQTSPSLPNSTPSQTPSTTQISPTPTTTAPTTTQGTTEPTQGTTEPTQGTTEPTQGTTEPTEPAKCTQEPTESNTDKPAEKLASTKDKDWLMYVTIALAVIVVIMGITIFLLIWQLYRNHRFFKLKRQEEEITMKSHDNQGLQNA